jgi:hypothetical protein
LIDLLFDPVQQLGPEILCIMPLPYRSILTAVRIFTPLRKFVVNKVEFSTPTKEASQKLVSTSRSIPDLYTFLNQVNTLTMHLYPQFLQPYFL